MSKWCNISGLAVEIYSVQTKLREGSDCVRAGNTLIDKGEREDSHMGYEVFDGQMVVRNTNYISPNFTNELLV